MCRICGSDDVVIRGDEIALVCEKCREEEMNAAEDWQEEAGREKKEEVIL